MRRKPNHSHHNKSNRRRGGNGYRGDNAGARIKSVTANRDKYLNMSRDALASGDRIESEYYLQHAEHYSRVLLSLQEDDNRARAEQAENNTPAEADGNHAGAEKPQGELVAEAC